MKSFKTQSGMTIIELLVTLTLASILVSVAIPSFREVTANQRISTTVNNLVASMILARSEAAKQRRHVTICASADGVSCSANLTGWENGWIVFANTTSDELTRDAANEPLIQTYPAPKGISNITLTAANGAVALLSYRPNGVIGNIGANQARLFTTCDARGAQRAAGVLISRSGRAKVSAKGFADAALACL